MSDESIVRNVVKYVVSEIAEKSDEVKVDIVDSGDGDVIAEVQASKSDMGRIIGRQGRVVNAIRTLVRAIAARHGKRVTVEIV